jgi:protein-S-isoprenylcysteine O-methyltransferase Ste14
MEWGLKMEIKHVFNRLPKNLLPPTFFIICAVIMIFIGLIWPVKNIITFPYNLIGILVLFFGLGISMWGSNKFRQVGTNIQTFDEPDILITDGLFKYSRNPMYLGFLTALLGLFIILGAVSPIILVFIFLIITDQWYITFEEEMMVRKFGKKYIDYQSMTRKWI